MKKIIKYFSITSAILAAAACTDEAEEFPVSFNRELTFIASREGVSPDTKTLRMDDGSTWWHPTEEISMFYGSGSGGGSKFTSQNATLQKTVEFDGSIQMNGTGKEFWAVYPYSQENECDGTSITTIIPSTQVASEGNFSGDSFPAMAKSKTLDLAFWNICGGVKFFVSRSDIKSVTFKGNNGETLAGKVKVTFDASGVPAVTEVLDGEQEITLGAPDGGCFKAGKYYYISLLPVALDGGFTLFFRAETAKGSVISNNPQTIKRSIFGVLKNIDSKVQNWEDALLIPDAVDLGLSVLWATFNVGASAPEEYGNYYAFGETAPKDEYTRANYIYPTTIEYSSWNNNATRTVVYYERILSPECDVAHVSYGGKWRMPTRAEYEELIEDCSCTWTSVNGIDGYLFTSKINGNSIFLPDAGFKKNDDVWDEYGPGYGIFYWSSSTKDNPYLLENGIVESNHSYASYYYEYSYFGQSVRAVRPNPNTRHVNSLNIDKTEITLYEGRSEDLIFSVLPETAANRKVICTSSAPDVASVSWRGEYSDWEDYKSSYAYVNALKAGTAIITVTTADGGLQASCKVNVMPKQVMEAVNLGLSVKWASINLGMHGPEEYGDHDDYYEWVHGGNYGKYTGNNAESSLDAEDDVVHVTLGGNWRMPTIEEWKELVESCTWSWTTVHGVSGKKVTSNNNGESIFLPASGYTYRFSDLWPMSDRGNMGYYWSSTTKIGSNGRGQALLFDSSAEYLDREFYESDNQYNQDYDYFLSVRPVYDDRIYYPESVSLNKSALSLYVGYNEQLIATVLPKNATDKTVKWASDRTDVAIVDENGYVTAIAAGSAIITATTTLGAKTVTCSVTVVEPPKPEAVDLGLPSGIKWASWNIEASAPEEFGYYFAWGETKPKGDYSWSTYKFELGSDYHGPFSKYVTKSSYGTVDNKTVLDFEDDVAHAHWGDSWRMPTYSEWKELRENCTWTWTIQNGVKGYLVTGSNDNSIFLPAAGNQYDTDLSSVGVWGSYWSSSLNTDNPYYAYYVNFNSSSVYWVNGRRNYGFSVRPVCN